MYENYLTKHQPSVFTLLPWTKNNKNNKHCTKYYCPMSTVILVLYNFVFISRQYQQIMSHAFNQLCDSASTKSSTFGPGLKN